LSRARWGSLSRPLTVLIVTVLLAACGDASSNPALPAHRPSAPPVHALSIPDPSTTVPAPLTEPGLDLRAGPVDVPLELRIPSLQVSAPVLGVGMTAANVMDAPKGPVNDPVWQKVFWYRGGGIPGSASTATLAAHVDDVLGRPAVFAHLNDLRPGDSIVIRDTRTGLDIEFRVTETVTYTLQQTLEPAVLSRIYGTGPVAGQGPQPSVDGLSHLTLITCTGSYLSGLGMYDHRLAVYAVRAPS
jgi:sortase (surface protein transpeptidase)